MPLSKRIQEFNKENNLDEKLTVYKLKKMYSKVSIKKKIILYKPVNPKKYNDDYYI